MTLRSPLAAAFLLLAAAFTPACAEPWVGKKVPAANLEYFDGAASFEGKPTILEFWATWCEPCLKMIPHLNEVQKKYKDRGLVVVGVSVDFKKNDVVEFRKKTSMNYTIAYDEDQKFSVEKMKVEVFPYAFAIDRTGKIVWEGLSEELKDETIEQILK